MRLFVMGEDATEREATAQEVEQMQSLVREAMGVGALDAVNTPALGGLGDRADAKALLANMMSKLSSGRVHPPL